MFKKCKLFASFICLLLALVMFTGCAQLTESPTAAKKEAETAAQEVLGKLVWGEADRTAITSNVTFTTSNKNYPNVKIEWSSSEQDVISNEGVVTRPNFDDPRAVKDGENNVVKVVITATVTATYSWGSEENTYSEQTDPISKQFDFSVLTLAEGIDAGTIKDVKARAWDYIYVQNGVDKALVSNSNVVYNVLLKGKVTGKLLSDGSTKGFFMHDGTEGIYVYGDNSANVGDTVEVIGEIYSYYGNLQVGSNITVNVIEDQGYELPDYISYTPQQWEDKTSGLGDDVIGRIGGDLVKVSGYLTAKAAPAGSGKYCLVDANTGEEAWIYYKSYTAEMEEVLKANVGKYVNLYGVSYDRDSRIMKNEILWTGEIEETEAPKVDDETKAQVALSQINLDASYTEDFDLSDAGAWEIVSGTGIEIVEGVAKVTRGDVDQEVVLKVTVTVGSATASKEIKVVVKALVKETPKNAGTKEDPYSVSDAVLVAGGLEVGGLTGTVYAIGEIVSIKEISASYGNATFNISDGKNEIIVFRAKFLNNEKFTSEDQIKVGDVVVICGQLTNYNGTLEFNSGCYVDSFGEIVEEGPFKVNTPYHFALEQTNLSKTLYLTGEMNGFYYAVTENTAEAAQVIVEEVEGGYNLKVVKVNGSVVYMDIVLNGTYVNVVFVEAPGTPFAYNEEFNTFTKEVDGKVRYIGTYGTYTTMSPSTIDKAATSFVAHLYDIKQGETPEPKHEHVACPECRLCLAEDCDGAENEKCAGHEIVTPTQGLKEGQAYRFTLVQPKAGKTVYFTGKMSSYYYATSTDINAGVDVFVEYVEGGLNLYFVDANGAKHYMGMAVSGTHINAVFDQDKTVFTYNEELKTVVGLVDGKEYVFGTRNDNTYTTIGANALSYDPFYVTFVAVGGEAPHEHVFVEGKCECGEVDPNYVPAHKHEACPKCGLCLVEDCEGEKCLGHEAQPETEGKAELTVNSLGIKDQTYAAGVANVNGVDFEFIQIGNYGNGIQMRDKNGNTSQLWNTSAFGKGIVKIELVYSSTMAVQYANPNAVIFQFGDGVGSYSYETKLSTTAGVKNYTITPDAETYTFFRLEHDLGYTMYWDSITIYFANGEVEAPHKHEFVEGKCECGEEDPNYVPPHVHEECPKCGLCLVEDCEGEKCLGHEVVVAGGKADFETVNNGTASSSYSDRTSTNGWAAKFAALNKGDVDPTKVSNPVFGFLGENVYALTIAGGTDKIGSITSPVIAGGLSKLTFNYTNLFTDTKISLTVSIKSAAGEVLYSEVIGYDNPDKVKYEVRTYELEFAVEGEFVIEIVNNCPNSSAGNKDRATIWNVAWVGAGKVEAPHVHEGGKATCKDLAVCAECGEAYGEFADHVWDDRGYSYNDEKHWVDCIICQVAKNNEVEHDFANGNCVCGKEAPHKHEACPKCGLCVAEDCDGTEEVKCAGHEAASAVTVTFVVADVAKALGWGSSSNNLKTAYAIDENVSISVAGGSNSGKFYTDHLRIYATDTPAGSITLTAAEGYKIQSVSFGLVTGTYAFLQFDGVTVQNGAAVEINAASAVFKTVKNGSDGKQVRLLSVTITYVAE